MTWFLDTALRRAAPSAWCVRRVRPAAGRRGCRSRRPEPVEARLEPAGQTRRQFVPPGRRAQGARTPTSPRCPGCAGRPPWSRGSPAALLGARIGWHLALLFLLYLVPVCVALSVVDWRTRCLPTRLIAPSYVVVGCSPCWRRPLHLGLAALATSVVGWLATFGVRSGCSGGSSPPAGWPTATSGWPGCWGWRSAGSGCRS